MERYRNAARAFNTEDSSAQNLGFRCARTAPGQDDGPAQAGDTEFNDAYIKELEGRAAGGCPHANGVLKSLEAQGKYIREAMGVQEEKKSLNDQLKELQARADQGLVPKSIQFSEFMTHKS